MTEKKEVDTSKRLLSAENTNLFWAGDRDGAVPLAQMKAKNHDLGIVEDNFVLKEWEEWRKMTRA